MRCLLLALVALTRLGLSSGQTEHQPRDTAISSAVCGAPCLYGEPGYEVKFEWPFISFKTQVLVTVVVQINTVAGFTTTKTTYGTATSVSGVTESGYITDITSFWNSKMGVTDIVVASGTPTITFKPHVYTAPGKYITVTTLITSPSIYGNLGFLAYTADYTLASLETTSLSAGTVTTYTICSKGSTSSIFALTPTTTPSGYSDPYQAPVGYSDWLAMLPASVKSTCLPAPTFAPAVAEVYVSALTATTTQYDDYVHSQSTPQQSKSPSSAKQSAAGTLTGNGNTKSASTTNSVVHGQTSDSASPGTPDGAGPASSAANAKATSSPTTETGKGSRTTGVTVDGAAGSGTGVQPAPNTGSATTPRPVSALLACAAVALGLLLLVLR